MKNKNLRQKIGLGLAGLGLVGVAGLIGCSEYGRAFSRGLAETMVVTATQESIKKEINPNAYPPDQDNRSKGRNLSEIPRITTYLDRTMLIPELTGMRVQHPEGNNINIIEIKNNRSCIVTHWNLMSGPGKIIYLRSDNLDQFYMPDAAGYLSNLIDDQK